MRVRAPASSANLGPGFDVLAVALTRYVEVEVREADSLQIMATGEGSHLPRDEDHLAVRVCQSVLGHTNVEIRIDSQIPIARGLGSSAALALATAAAAGADDPLAVAVGFEGHPENAAAAAHGGLVAATLVEADPVVVLHPLDAYLRFVLVVPDFELSTEKAREVLATTISRADAVFNLGRMGVLLAGLSDHRVLEPELFSDRLHQDVRSSLFPEAPGILKQFVDAGALGSCWSGAGPTLLGVCAKDNAEDVRDSMRSALTDEHPGWQIEVVAPDLRGLIVVED